MPKNVAAPVAAPSGPPEAEADIVSHNRTSRDHRLQLVIEVWDSLPDNLRNAILAIIDYR